MILIGFIISVFSISYYSDQKNYISNDLLSIHGSQTYGEQQKAIKDSYSRLNNLEKITFPFCIGVGIFIFGVVYGSSTLKSRYNIDEFAKKNIVAFEYLFFGQIVLLFTKLVSINLFTRLEIVVIGLFFMLLGITSLSLPNKKHKLLITFTKSFLSIFLTILILTSIIS